MSSSGFTTATSGLAVAMLRFRCQSTSASVDDESVESGDPESFDITVGIACISVVERDI